MHWVSSCVVQNVNQISIGLKIFFDFNDLRGVDILELLNMGVERNWGHWRVLVHDIVNEVLDGIFRVYVELYKTSLG